MTRAKKKFGQNFLNDPLVIEKIINALHISPEDQIVEIGPGPGALTEQMIGKAGKLTVVEIDRDLIPGLEKLFLNHDQQKWQILNQDALELELSPLIETGKKIKIVGNLPYNISTPLLFHFIEQVDSISDMLFMLQKEVVDRICASPDNKDYGKLSLMLQYYCQCESLLDVPPECFNPAPKVNSAVIRLSPYGELPYPCKDMQLFSTIVSQSFSQRRKTLRNNLKKLNIEAELESLNIDGGLRAENISLQQYVELCNRLYDQGFQNNL